MLTTAVSIHHFVSYACVIVLAFILFRYWRYSEEMKTMDPGYPKPITVWKGIPDSPQGAFVHKENGMQYMNYTLCDLLHISVLHSSFSLH